MELSKGSQKVERIILLRVSTMEFWRGEISISFFFSPQGKGRKSSHGQYKGTTAKLSPTENLDIKIGVFPELNHKINTER